MLFTSKISVLPIENLLIMLRLWNGSWADDSVRWDEESRVAYEPSRIKKIEHNGSHTLSGEIIC